MIILPNYYYFGLSELFEEFKGQLEDIDIQWGCYYDLQFEAEEDELHFLALKRVGIRVMIINQPTKSTKLLGRLIKLQAKPEEDLLELLDLDLDLECKCLHEVK